MAAQLGHQAGGEKLGQRIHSASSCVSRVAIGRRAETLAPRVDNVLGNCLLDDASKALASDGEELRAVVEGRIADPPRCESSATRPESPAPTISIERASLRGESSRSARRCSNADVTTVAKAKAQFVRRCSRAAPTLRPMARVLVTEKIAEAGLQLLRDAGHDVSVRLKMTPEELLTEVPDAEAIVIRSSTRVTGEVIASAPNLIAVGRAGVGLDNVDVAAATQRGVMVINAPQSNVLSAAEHTMSLLLAQARNVPQAHAALKDGRWERSKWTGVEIADKVLGIVGLGRIGALVAERARAFGMELIAYDPFVPDDKARALNVQLVDLDELVARSDFMTLHLAKTPETIGLVNATLRVINVARGGIIDEADLAAAVANGTIAGAAIDVFATEPTTESPLFGLDSVVVTPHLGASTAEAQDKAGITIAEQLELALAGDFVPFAVNVSASPADEKVRPFVPLCEELGARFAALAKPLPTQIEVEFIGEIAEFDNQLASLSVVKGMLGALGGGPVSFVNAIDVARERGVSVRTISTPQAQDHVNVVSIAGGDHNINGTVASASGALRLVGIDGHSIDLPIADNTLVVRNSDQPGMIGHVTSVLGEAGMNIDDMAVGQSATGPALMAIITPEPVGADVLERIIEADGIESAACL